MSPDVAPPDPHASLTELAANVWSTWDPDARALFADLDPDGFRACGQSPPALLADLGPRGVAAALARGDLGARLAHAHRRLRAELDAPSSLTERDGAPEPLVAYLCCEFGLDASLPLYSGGLGILAGDHLKSASDLRVPLVGVGLLYRRGYFCQGLDAEGRQTESYPPNVPERMGMAPAADADGRPVVVSVEMGDGPVRARVWRLAVGRVPLLLLDADLPENDTAARALSGALYGGDRELRIRQELLLGVGGARALAALGLTPSVFHLNEGHSAFVVLERLRALVADGADRAAAMAAVRASTVFTTHTPVPAGNEVFDPALVLRHLEPIRRALGLSAEELLRLGRVEASDPGFGLTPLALRSARYANGVSALHGEVSRELWRGLWPGRAVEAVPIDHVTNGVHVATWVAPALADPDALSDAELWAAHGVRRRALIELVARRAGAAAGAGRGLDPDALTIGFARRFATYKRADLVLSDPARLAALVGDAERPLQLVFAGKAHPADEGGKALIQRVVRLSREPRFAGRVVFAEDYDMELARHLVQGVDVWLNTPLRPQEASGTSGMKAAMNGVPNLSVLDGWWAEGYDPARGWAIADGEGAGDAGEAAHLYRLLEHEVLPRFFDRDAAGVPVAFVATMRAALADARARFSSTRMVRDYVSRAYRLGGLAGDRSAPSRAGARRAG